MTVLKFSGEVQTGDTCRVSYDDDDDEINGAIHIGGRDVVDEVANERWSGPVTVAIADARFTGDLSVDHGWGYSEYTPVDSDTLTVGAHDIIALIEAAGASGPVTVWIADEPVDLLSGEQL